MADQVASRHQEIVAPDSNFSTLSQVCDVGSKGWNFFALSGPVVHSDGCEFLKFDGCEFLALYVSYRTDAVNHCS